MILPTLLHLRFTFSLYKLTPTYATITVWVIRWTSNFA
jgi:hypothetical protein